MESAISDGKYPPKQLFDQNYMGSNTKQETEALMPKSM